jgi:uncharacterized LabA/DUF88 family protein
MLKQFTTGRVAVFIDAANVFYAQKDLGWDISYGRLKSYLGKECDVSGMYIYTAIDPNNVRQTRFIEKLRSLGFVVVTRRIKKIRGPSEQPILKGNVDTELSMGMLDNIDHYDTAVLMSGDSDFAPVIDRIRSLGKKIIVMSTKKHVSRELLDRAKYINLKKLKDEIGFGNKP